jgi:CRISPR-associated exonuclease Cas4
MENTSEDVLIGKLISSNTYERRKHDIHIVDEDGGVYMVLDFIDRENKVIYEVKKSNKMEELHIWQVKYYIYVLEKLGIKGYKGIINYPKQRRRILVELTDDDRRVIEEVINSIEEILSEQEPPPVINKPYCKKCSYYEFCYC